MSAAVPTRKFTSFEASDLASLTRQLGEFARDVYSKLDALPTFELVQFDGFINPTRQIVLATSVKNPTHVLARTRPSASPEEVVTVGAYINFKQVPSGIMITSVLPGLSTVKYRIDFLIIGDF